MTTLQAKVLSDLQVIENALGNQTFTWDGEDYVCIPSGATDADAVLSAGGFGSDKTQSFTVRIQLFNGVIPVTGNVLTFNGIDLDVSSVSVDATQTFLVVHCALPSP